MDTLTTTTPTASVFEASTKNPQAAVGTAVAEVARLLAKFKESQDIVDRMNLLTEIEALRRFVLVRGALVKALQQLSLGDARNLGKELCDTLRAMIGEMPELVKSCSLQGARNMERDTRRAIASLGFVGSLDASFA